MDKYEEYKDYFNFFKDNPKSVILFLSCIKDSHYVQEVANTWFKESSPVFSKENTISKMLEKKLIVLERKEKKTYYYRTPSSAITKALLASHLKKNIVILEQFADNKEKIDKFFESDLILEFFDLEFLKNIFLDTKSLEKYGIDYIEFVFSLRFFKQVCDGGMVKNHKRTEEDVLKIIETVSSMFKIILPDMGFKISLFFEKILELVKKDPQKFIKEIEDLPLIDAEIDRLQISMIKQLMSKSETANDKLEKP